MAKARVNDSQKQKLPGDDQVEPKEVPMSQEMSDAITKASSGRRKIPSSPEQVSDIYT